MRKWICKTFIPEKESPKRRIPVPTDNLRKIQAKCVSIDDDMRWLIALISDSGMRLAEAVGLLKTDINLETDIPFIELKPHEWRPLKTENSTRLIPLVGHSLWACDRILNNGDSVFAFPRYMNGSRCNSNSASATLNKWLRPMLPESCRYTFTKKTILFTSLGQFHLTFSIALKSERLKYHCEQNRNQKQPNLLQHYPIGLNA